jgi:SNF2 family DNA or RNA helicase
MTIEFRPWQPLMIDHIADNPRCGVLAGMGSGKTMATLTAVSCADLLDEGPTLVIGPKRVANKTWPDEVKAWPHLRHLEISPIIGTQTERFQALARDVPIYSINYDNLPWLVDHLGISRWPFRTVIADELTRLKSFRLRQGGKRAASLSRVAHTKVKRFIGLTGTPAPNGLKDLWGQLWFMDKGERLGRTYEGYMDRWFQKPVRGGDHVGVLPVSWAQDQIQDRIRDICITVDPRDYIDVPEPIFNRINVELPPKARAMYRDMEREMFLQIREHEIEAVHAASRTIKCLQLANGAIYLNKEATLWEPIHEAKLEALESIVEEAAGMPVLVAYHFRTDLQRLKKHFPHGRVFDDDPKTEDAWNSGKIPVMFIHPASGGHGVNLQYGGNILAFFGHWWDMELRDQVIERIGPMRQFQSGLNRLVTIHDIVAENTVDEDVLLRHESKRGVQDILMEAMKRRG